MKTLLISILILPYIIGLLQYNNAKMVIENLTDKTDGEIVSVYDINPDYFDLFMLTQSEAKLCALVAVEEIIAAIPTQPSKNENESIDAIMYWINVKQEIENI